MNWTEPADSTEKNVHTFIERWESSGAAERANYQLFLSELCFILNVPCPEPAKPDNRENGYVFERSVTFQDGAGNVTTNFIDLYKRGCFVLEAKQGSEKVNADEPPLSEAEKKLQAKLKKGTALRGTKAWDDAMIRARGQGEKYIRALPAAEGRPPFLMVADVGHSIEIYSEFTCTGGNYIPFPAPGSHRIFLQDLVCDDIRERLRAAWTDPLSLDPSRRSARVTKEIAERLARLAVSLEKQKHDPQAVAAFLMRCLFTMFAEDVYLLPKGAFTRLLESLKETPEHFAPMVEELWQKMDTGGFSTSLRQPVWQFNGGLFAESAALPLNRDQLMLLIEAAQCDWRDVEPAIFGTLLERALDPVERHKLGAHYTPRAYVERLVLETIIKPVRAAWESVEAAAVSLLQQDQKKKAVSEALAFHRYLCGLRILDPACGSGNFLYVALEHLKRIEGEVFDLLDRLGEQQGVLDMAEHTVYPNQLLGLEINPRAAAITELVLWIGTLQWHYRNRGVVRPPQPIIRNFHNIECRDALIEWDATEPVLDDHGVPVTHWDGRTTRPHPVTGREVPDESARIPVMRYVNPRRTEWPEADFVVGNPPFIGPARMRDALGDGYTEAVRKTHADVGESSDFVMYWWNHAADLARDQKIRRFGFVSTNSLRQKFNRRTLERHMTDKTPLSIVFAIPDHPWVDAVDGAAVRIAMTVGVQGELPGLLQTVTRESANHGDHYDVEVASQTGKIHPDLTLGADVASAQPLKANKGLASEGMKPHGTGFLVTPEEARQLGLGHIPGLENYIRTYMNGRDVTQSSRGMMIIDCFGMKAEEVRNRFPEVYQWLMQRVKPDRDAKKGRSKDADKYAEEWWLFGKTRNTFRPALVGLDRYVVTVKTAKHRIFTFLDKATLPDSKLIAFAFDNAFALGVLSSRIHCHWAVSAGSNLGVGNDPTYVIGSSFETFPFPDTTDEQKDRIRKIAEQLDAHRKRQQALHPELTLTDMYNVLEKLRSPHTDALSDREKVIYEHGLIGILNELHDELDRAVFDAYGWPADLSAGELLQRLVDLNHQRVAEEQQGQIRWLRPEYQNPDYRKQAQPELGMDLGPAPVAESAPAEPERKLDWPKKTSEQIRELRNILNQIGAPLTVDAVARRFNRAPRAQIQDLLQTLETLGQIHQLPDGRYEANPTAGTVE